MMSAKSGEVGGRADCLCGSKRREFLFSGRDRFLGKPGVFGVVRCLDCGLFYTDPRLRGDDFATYYPPGDYYSFQAKARGGWKARAKAVYRDMVLHYRHGYPLPENVPSAIALLLGPFISMGLFPARSYFLGYPRYQSGARVLDVGCGSGAFLDEMKPHGFDTYGLDLDEAAVESARSKGHQAVNVHIEDIPWEDNSFDIIRASHVLEHMPDPYSAISRIYKALKPGGSFIILLPNIESSFARKYGTFWFNLDLPRHIYHFSPGTLARAVEGAGLQVKNIVTHNTVKGFLLSRQYIKEESRGEPFGGYRLRPWHLLLAPYVWLMGRGSKGEIMFMECRKP